MTTRCCASGATHEPRKNVISKHVRWIELCALDVKLGAEGALFLASSSRHDESVRLAGKGLLDPPFAKSAFID
jgi:hypothetical protein